ncbi:single-stranded DNA-binding protein [Microbacterium sp. A93]|uniref:single-stranded DNA-binding protein n=1 Tax=Microbacterium sp. A93 TaxID=3450716 RepID=UPI003F430665
MNETVLTIVGNLTAEPELRQTQSGVAVASFTIASTPRSFDRQANEWKDGEALFMRCSAWRDLATNITASLTKGSRVIASGRLQQRSYQDREGNSRVSMELQIDEIGPSLKYATAQVARGDRSGGSAAPVPAAPASTAPAAAATDSWSTPNAEWSVSDETPF